MPTSYHVENPNPAECYKGRFVALAALAVAAIFPSSGSWAQAGASEQGNEDAIVALCKMAGESQKVCDCSLQKLQSGISTDDFSFFAGAVGDYVKQVNEGQARGKAWKSAKQAAATRENLDQTETTARITRIGEAFQTMSKACGGKT